MEGSCGLGAGQRAAARELQRLAARPPPGIRLLLRDHDLTDAIVLIDGPAETPYFGGVFRVRITVTREFPAAPPLVRFLTRIFHPNVSAVGDVCVNTLKKDWRPELGLEHALLAVKCLLIAPNAESALNAEAGALLQARYDDYFRRAKLLTDIHARPSAAALTALDGANQQTLISHTQAKVVAAEDPSAEDHSANSQGAGAAAAVAAPAPQEEAPCAKRERRPRASRAAAPAAARERRRILKRL